VSSLKSKTSDDAPESEAKPAPVPQASSSDRSLGPVDALSAYMAQLGKYAPISREEEHALAVRWVEDGDEDAARQLVLANLRLVVKIAMEYRRAWTNVLDLIQSGNVGLLEAVQRFDPHRNVKLTSYAVYWIRAYILKYLMDNFRTVRLGRSRAQRKLFFRLNKEKRQLELEGFEVEPKLLAERLEVTEEDVIDMEQRMSQSDLSLNAPARRDDAGAETPNSARSSKRRLLDFPPGWASAIGRSSRSASSPRSRKRCRNSPTNLAFPASGCANSKSASSTSSATT